MRLIKLIPLTFSFFVTVVAAGAALANCVMQADEMATRGDWDSAFSLLEQCANNLDLDAQAMLGAYYSLPNTGHQSDELTLRWTRRAADAGSTLALTNLANFYEFGRFGILKDLESAANYYRMAANAGGDSARYRLAQMALFGLGIPADENFALELLRGRYEKMSEVGDDEYQIAAMYMHGYDRSGEGADIGSAQRYYDISARSGNRGAQYFLSKILLASDASDLILQGLMWLSVSARNNHPLAHEEMEVLFNKIDPSIRQIINLRAIVCLDSFYAECQ
jgi:uncharacterized protein